MGDPTAGRQTQGTKTKCPLGSVRGPSGPGKRERPLTKEIRFVCVGNGRGGTATLACVSLPVQCFVRAIPDPGPVLARACAPRRIPLRRMAFVQFPTR